MAWVWAAIAAYVIAQMAIAAWAGRFTKNDADYLVAGRRLGLLAVSLSLFATWFGGDTVMGSTAAVAEEGLAGSRAEPFGYAICLVFMALLIAAQFRARGYITLADFFRDRFGPRAETAAVLLNIPVSTIWAAAQILALGSILSAVAGVELQLGLFGACVLVIAYTTLGGLLGDVVTDIIQGGILIIGLVILLVMVFARAGGVGAGFSLIEPSQLVFISEGESWIDRIDAWAIPILGSLVTQEPIARFLGAKTPKIARNACLVAAGIYLVVGVIPVLAGLIGSKLGVAPADAGDLFLPALAREIMPPFLYVMLIGALLSAVLSTVDSTLLSVSGLATENVYARLRPAATGAQKLLVARIVTAVAGVVAYAIASSGQTIYELVEATSSLGTAGVLVCVLWGLWSGFGREWASLAAMGASLLAIIIFDYATGIPGGFLASLAAALLAYGVVGWLEADALKARGAR